MTRADLLLFTVFAPLALAMLAPVVFRWVPKLTHWIYSILALTVFATLSFLAPAVITDGHRLSLSYQWMPSFGIQFSLALDGLSLLFAWMISGIGAAIFFYSGPYFEEQNTYGRFIGFMSFFMASMLGLVLAADLVTLFVFWELTSISSFFLIGFEHEETGSRHSAKQALLITSGAGLFMMAGVILLGQIVGSYQFAEILAQKELIQGHSYYVPAVLLILVGAGAKSAQFPLHFWLPAAMKAPTPVSAYLHSATMVKGGIYLLARLSPALGGTAFWLQSVGGLGIITMLVSSLLVFLHKDMKLVLAYLTIMVLGLLTFLFGLSTKEAVMAALVYMLAHSLYKASLFMVAGIIDHATGTRDLSQLHGLALPLKWTFVASCLAGFSMIGMIPSLGFVGKEMVYKSLLPEWGVVVLLLAVFVAMTAGGLHVSLRPFLSSSNKASHEVYSTPTAFWAPAMTLGVAGIVLGATVGYWGTPVINVAAQTVLVGEVKSHVQLWHGWNKELMLSLATLALGIVGYLTFSRVRKRLSWLHQIFHRHGSQYVYDQALHGLNLIATRQTKWLQNGNLRFYISVVIGFSILLTFTSLWRNWYIHLPDSFGPVLFHEWVALALISGGAVFAVIARSMLVTTVSMGASGYGITLLFVMFSVPDLALTQFLVETMTVILISLVFTLLPGHIVKTRGALNQACDLILSIGMGCVLVLVMWNVLSRPFQSEVVDFYKNHSVSGGHGRNIINVILVDFRALDTLGEATVIVLAGLGVLSLIRLRPQRMEKK